MTTFALPQSLSITDLVDVVAPSGPVRRDNVESGVSLLPFPHRFSPHLFDTDGFFAGFKQSRLHDLQTALDQTDTHAILCARGGFGASDLLDSLSFETFCRKPKWLIGSSDITALLVHLWAFHGMCSIHGPMAGTLTKNSVSDVQLLCKLLTCPDHSHQTPLHSIQPGKGNGPLLGGNLTVLAHLIGTFPIDSFSGALLFLEDVTELPYRIERCLVQLRRSGLFDKITGVVLGEFTQCHPGKDNVRVETVLERNLRPIGVPVASMYPAAHGARNRPFVHGYPMTLEVTDTTAVLSSVTSTKKK
ncbi:MAG: LD-carboxypeptidase [Deltaproteobacteria bacterium]|nr:LD-carboxypeptidase [Deltaproteobacteria bacterium]MBN2670039.1 LD-carboxypeptidase [Deltaproteobacteria bacterium]